MSWARAVAAFVYDFLADDGWELLVGLLVVLPLTFLVSAHWELAGGVLLIAGVLLTLAVSLGRKLPRPH